VAGSSPFLLRPVEEVQVVRRNTTHRLYGKV
jgi:hypothetical protein